jgi:hypothetical protein
LLARATAGLGTDLAVITELATRLGHGARFTAEQRAVFEVSNHEVSNEQVSNQQVSNQQVSNQQVSNQQVSSQRAWEGRS